MRREARPDAKADGERGGAPQTGFWKKPLLNCEAVSAAEIDEYLGGTDEPKRRTFQALRDTILDVVPAATITAPPPRARLETWGTGLRGAAVCRWLRGCDRVVWRGEADLDVESTTRPGAGGDGGAVGVGDGLDDGQSEPVTVAGSCSVVSQPLEGLK